MAIVADLALSNSVNPGNGPVGTADQEMNTASRTNAGNPNGTLTPAFTGELVLDTLSATLWRASSTTNNSWVPSVVEA